MKGVVFGSLFLTITFSWSNAVAVQDFFEDIAIREGTPGIIFDDTTDNDGLDEWYIRGRDEFFSIIQVSVAGVEEQILRIQSTTAAFGPGAEASGTRSLALGRGAESLRA